MAVVEPKWALQKIDFWGCCRIFPAPCGLFASVYMSQMPIKLYRETSWPQPFYQPRGEVTARGTWGRICRDLPEKSWRFCCLLFA